MIKEFIKDFKVSDLVPFERNPRKNQKAIDAVIKSIKSTGNNDPIEVNEQNVILAGHTRAMALKKMGIETTDILRISGMTEQQQKDYRILSNKTAEVAEWDFEILQEDFKMDELIDLGFDIKDLDQGEVIEDEAPPIPETPKTVLGDVYELNGHRVMCGDSTFIDSIEKLLNGDKPSLLFTDPPYGVDRGEGFGGFGGFGKPIKRRQYEDGEWDKKRIGKDFFQNIDIISDNQIIFGGNFYTDYLPVSGHWIVWDKKQTMPTFGDCELAWTSIDRKSVKLYEVVFNGLIGKEKERFHPTQKPLKLILEIIKDYSKQDEIILDPFSGSGTMLIACEQAQRKAVCVELSPNYVDVIVQRWVNFTKCTKIKRNGIEIDWPVNTEEKPKNA
jgi:DNA modification methylase